MSKEDNLKKYVQNTYDELHAPEGLRRKVMNMTEMKAKKTGMSLGKKLAMAAAIAASVADGPVTILGAECVAKSYPSFWQEYEKLGGNYEQHIR